MTHLCMLLIATVWFLAGCQVPTNNPSSTTLAQAITLEQPGTNLLRLFATHRCYRLMGRQEEARAVGENIKAMVERGEATLFLLQQLITTLTQHGPQASMDTDYIASVRRYKQACRERLGIYELTLRWAPLTGRPFCARPRHPGACYATSR